MKLTEKQKEDKMEKTDKLEKLKKDLIEKLDVIKKGIENDSLPAAAERESFILSCYVDKDNILITTRELYTIEECDNETCLIFDKIENQNNQDTLNKLIHQLTILKGNFSKAYDHVVSECKRLNINIKER